MISKEQLADALARLDPRDSELLGFSLRRRVPDQALARLYDTDPQEVARARAGAIERLAEDLRIERGEDLGSVLQALLEDDTWRAAEQRMPERPRLAAAATGARDDPVGPLPEPTAGDGGGEQAPVLDMLARAPEPIAAERARGGPPLRWILAGCLAAVALGGGAAVLGATLAGDGEGERGARGQTRHFVPASEGPLADPFPSERSAASCYPTATVRRSTVLYRRPGGKRKLRISARTEWGSPRVLGVVRRRGGWLAVQAPELRNGDFGWLPARLAQVDCVRWSLHADLSRRRLVVRRDGRTVRAMSVAIGSPRHPTPKGRFTVTDRLRVTDRASPYGCCVLALTGHQTRLPPDWPGGDRLAVHATTDQSSIGKPVSLGCMRALPGHARWLINEVPLGAPIFIRA